MSIAKKFFSDTLFDISLERLYTLQSAINYAIYDNFSGIILRLGDDMLEEV